MGILLWVGVVILGFGIYFWKKIYDFCWERHRFIKAVDKFPRPPALPIFGSTLFFKWNVADFAKQILEWGLYFQSQGHGLATLRIRPFPTIFCLKPEEAKAVLESNTVITKGKEYEILKRWLGTGLLISTGDKWRQRRKMLTSAFHFNVLNSFLRIYNGEAEIFVEQLEKYADSGQIFNLFPYLKRCALDIICETSMGTKVNAQTNPKHPYVTAVQRMNELSFNYNMFPLNWIKPIWYATGKGGEYDRCLKLVTDFTRNVIAIRAKEFEESASHGESYNFNDAEMVAKKKLAFLDLLLSVQKEGKLTEEDI
uniref:Cytochrome P450 n=1 Tax=Panagrolaimus superbus TaxID=310955 RepID=A0A914Z395_9BILA